MCEEEDEKTECEKDDFDIAAIVIKHVIPREKYVECRHFDYPVRKQQIRSGEYECREWSVKHKVDGQEICPDGDRCHDKSVEHNSKYNHGRWGMDRRGLKKCKKFPKCDRKECWFLHPLDDG
jgi:hypothetical protein